MPKDIQPPKRRRQGFDESNSRIRCHYCNSEMLKRNIVQHSKTRHPGMEYKWKPLTTNAKKDGSVTEYFSRDLEKDKEKNKAREEAERLRNEMKKHDQLKALEEARNETQEKMINFKRQKELLLEEQRLEKEALEKRTFEEQRRAVAQDDLLNQLENASQSCSELECSQNDLLEREEDNRKLQAKKLVSLNSQLSTVSRNNEERMEVDEESFSVQKNSDPSAEHANALIKSSENYPVHEHNYNDAAQDQDRTVNVNDNFGNKDTNKELFGVELTDAVQKNVCEKKKTYSDADQVLDESEVTVITSNSSVKKRHMSEPSQPYTGNFSRSIEERLSAVEAMIHSQSKQFDPAFGFRLSNENIAAIGNQVKEVITPLQVSMDDLSNLFSEMKTNSQQKTKSKNENKKGKSCHEMARFKLAVEGPRSIEELIERLPDNLGLHFSSMTEKAIGLADGIHCKACAPEVCSSLELSPGVLRYDPTQKSVDEKGNLKRSFSNLKKKVLSHFKSSLHQEKVDASLTEEEVKHHLSYLERNQIAGMNCFRNVYSSIKDSHSYLSYSRKIASDFNKGVNVGNFNHSEEFPAQMVTPIYDVLREKLMEQLDEILPGTGRRCPLSIMMDKYTSHLRTLNIIGLNAFLGPKDKRSLRCVFLDSYVVKDHSAKGICSSLQSSLDESLNGTNWRSRYNGTVVDGGMLHLNYHNQLDREINQLEGSSDFFLHLWDSTHLVELAHHDLSKEKCFEWVKKTENTITEMNKSHRWGKELERIIGFADEKNDKIYKPRLFSTTRWRMYSYDVYKNTHNNFEYMYRNLTEHKDDLVNKIGHVTFAMDMSTLTDISKQQGILSATLQSTDLFDWHVTKNITRSNAELQAMASALRNANLGYNELSQFNFEGGKPLLAATASAIKELETKCEFHGQAMTIKQHLPMASGTRKASKVIETQDTDLSTAIMRSREKAAALLDKIVQKTNARFQGQQNPDTEQGGKKQIISQCMAELFDMESIFQRNVENVPIQALEMYSNLAKKAGFLEQNCTLKSLSKQYKGFQNALQNHAKRSFMGAEGPRSKRIEEVKFYTKLMNGQFGANEFKDINHLLLTSMVRLSNESQVESMASTLKRVHENRGGLGLKKLSKEVFIVKNGPPATAKADPLGKLALNKYFGGPDKWNFVAKDKGNGLYAMGIQPSSKVINRINDQDGTISFDS